MSYTHIFALAICFLPYNPNPYNGTEHVSNYESHSPPYVFHLQFENALDIRKWLSKMTDFDGSEYFECEAMPNNKFYMKPDEWVRYFWSYDNINAQAHFI